MREESDRPSCSRVVYRVTVVENGMLDAKRLSKVWVWVRDWVWGNVSKVQRVK